jgi:hypothetical protein
VLEGKFFRPKKSDTIYLIKTKTVCDLGSSQNHTGLRTPTSGTATLYRKI